MNELLFVFVDKERERERKRTKKILTHIVVSCNVQDYMHTHHSGQNGICTAK